MNLPILRVYSKSGVVKERHGSVSAFLQAARSTLMQVTVVNLDLP